MPLIYGLALAGVWYLGCEAFRAFGRRMEHREHRRMIAEHYLKMAELERRHS